MISRGTRRSIAAALTAATLVGCSSTSTTGTATKTPSASTSPAPSPTPSPSRTVTRPVLPDAAAQPTRDGAAAFVRYFFETYVYAYATLDSEPFRAASEAECEFCLKILKRVEDARSAGGSISGGDFTVLSTLVSPGKPETGLVVVTRFRQKAVDLVDANGNATNIGGAAEDTCQLVLGWRPSGWQVFELTKVS